MNLHKFSYIPYTDDNQSVYINFRKWLHGYKYSEYSMLLLNNNMRNRTDANSDS